MSTRTLGESRRGASDGPAFVTAAEAHLIDAKILAALIPRLSPGDLHEVRVEFARRIQIDNLLGHCHRTWQDAWNTWTGASSEGQRGVVVFEPSRCAACRGLGSAPPAALVAPAPVPIDRAPCGACSGSGRGTVVVQTTALHAREATGADEGPGQLPFASSQAS